ncbi:MAG: sterol desaturase family protein [Ignavibacteriae bacterium]|nr:sterol desaturase family protein [Ignavibacteriota bacterium]
MEKLFQSNKDETIRLFKSDFIEIFSRIHWSVPLFLYVPIVCFFLFKTIFINQLSLFNLSSLFVLGMIFWSILEYFLHRFVFHYEPKSETGKKLSFIMHGIHHAYPNDSKRLVMPPSISVPLGIFFYFLTVYIFGSQHQSPFYAGLVSGYLCYDMMHYAVHHSAIRNKFFLKIKSNHMKHHYQVPGKGYGVSQPLWDYVFRTKV